MTAIVETDVTNVVIVVERLVHQDEAQPCSEREGSSHDEMPVPD